MTAAAAKSMPFVRNLASSDVKLRNQSLEALRAYLSSRCASSPSFSSSPSSSSARRQLNYTDCLKLWKSLFYALWMTDKPGPQQRLCDDLASLHILLDARTVAAAWWPAFFDVMGRHWTTGIDVLRMNKFLLLVRRVVGQVVAWPGRMEWTAEKAEEKKEETEEVMGRWILFGVAANHDEGGEQAEQEMEDAGGGVIQRWMFDAEGDARRIPVGLRLHILDVWVDEMEKAGLLEEDASASAQRFVNEMRKLVQRLTKCSLVPVRIRAREVLQDQRLPGNREEAQMEDAGEGKQPKKANSEGVNSENTTDGWEGFDD